LTRFAPEADVLLERQWITDRIGTLVTITEYFGAKRIVYASFFSGGVAFAVTAAQVVEQSGVARVCGYRRSGSFDISNAVKVVSKMTMHAVRL
jgi:hypothetical protein